MTQIWYRIESKKKTEKLWFIHGCKYNYLAECCDILKSYSIVRGDPFERRIVKVTEVTTEEVVK